MRINLAGPLLFTTTTTPGLAMDGIFYWTGKGLNWDVYGHNPASPDDPGAKLPCTAGCERLQHRRSDGDQLLRVVPGSQQAAAGRSVRRRGRRRPGDAARSEHLHQRRMVRRQSLPRSEHAARPQRGTAACRRVPRLRPARSPTRRPARRASRSCGTRTTSARSRPTTYSPAE